MRYIEKHNIGSILDYQNTPVFKMWSVDISAGKRPISRHMHLHFEIMMTDAGSGTYTTDYATYPICPGDIFIFSGNEQHCITEAGPEGLRITNLQFDPLFIRSSQPDAADLTSLSNTSFCFTHNEAFLNRIEASEAHSLVYLFNLIREEITSQKQEYVLSVKSYLYLLLIRLIREHNYLSSTDNINHIQMKNMYRALSYIDQHFTKKITLQELSALAGLTPNYFCALFKQVNKMTLWNYISAKRIDKAIQLITTEDSNENMLNIAAECGYNNTANFNKAFKKITGMTPSEYRNSSHSMIS